MGSTLLFKLMAPAPSQVCTLTTHHPPPRQLHHRDGNPTVRAAPNRLLDLPTPTAPNRVWVGDITYLPSTLR